MTDHQAQAQAADAAGSAAARRIGLLLRPTPGAANDVHDVVEQARVAHALGVPAVWFGQRYDYDSLSLSAVVGAAVPGLRVGTSVVPIGHRHPLVVAGQAQTAQAAAGGRFDLGLGLGAPVLEQQAFGSAEARPIRRLREYLTALRALIDSGSADLAGETLTARPPTPATVHGGTGVPLLVAAMGPQALAVTGELADGTVPFLAGRRVLEREIVPALKSAATAAGRPSPRVVVTVLAVVTADPDRVRAAAHDALAFYERIPSYRGVLDREGVERAVDLALIGDEAHVSAGLLGYLDAGATELSVTQTALGGPQDQQRTWELVGALNH